MQHRFPRLHSFVIDDTLTIKDMMELSDPTDNLHLPLSAEAFEEFNQLQAVLPLVNLREGERMSGNGHPSLVITSEGFTTCHAFRTLWLIPYSGGSRNGLAPLSLRCLAGFF